MPSPYESPRTVGQALDRIIPTIQTEIQALDPDTRAQMLGAVMRFCGIGLVNSGHKGQQRVSPETIDGILGNAQAIEDREVLDRIF